MSPKALAGRTKMPAPTMLLMMSATRSHLRIPLTSPASLV
jgi:hypothetical protein